MKKIICTLLVVCMVISAFAVSTLSVSAENTVSSNTSADFEYSVNPDGNTATVTKFIGEQNSVLIPGVIDGYSVTSIGDKAFSGCDRIFNVTIPEGVEIIGNGAFENCIRLEEIKLADSIKSIGNNAFYGCLILTDVSLPLALESIGEGAFEDCITLNTVVFPDTLKAVGDFAFENCRKIKSVRIPANVADIGVGVFMGCNGIKTVEVSAENPVYDSRENCNAIIETATDTLVSACNYTQIPKNVKAIGEWAFAELEHIESITLPQNLTNISDGAFWYCTSLAGLNIPKSLESVGYEAFVGCNRVFHVFYEGTEEDWGKITFERYNEYLTNATRHCEAYGTVLTYSVTTPPACTTRGAGIFECPLCEAEKQVVLYELAHDFENSVCTHCKKQEDECVESNHNYENYLDKTWTVYKKGAKSITLTFSDETFVEKNDYIFIYDKLDEMVGVYTEAELAGRQITVLGDRAKIKLMSDYSGTAYGFAVTNIEAIYEQGEQGVLGDADGDGIVNVKDASAIQKAVAKIVEFSEAQILCADVDKDGKITVKDASAVQKIAAKMSL